MKADIQKQTADSRDVFMTIWRTYSYINCFLTELQGFTILITFGMHTDKNLAYNVYVTVNSGFQLTP